MQQISVTTQKGGVGKTAISVHLAASLALHHHKRVLLVDLDSQGNSTEWLNQVQASSHLYKAVTRVAPLDVLITPTYINGLHLIGGGAYTAQLNQLSAGDLTAKIHQTFAELPSDWYDYVIFDTPPGAGSMTIAGIMQTKQAVIPVELAGMAAKGYIQTKQIFAGLSLKHPIRIRGVLANKLDRREIESSRILAQLREASTDFVYKTVIRINAPISLSFLTRQTVFDMAPRSRGARDLRAFTTEFVNQDQ